MLCVYLFSDQFNLKEIMLNIDLGNSPSIYETEYFNDSIPVLYCRYSIFKISDKTFDFKSRFNCSLSESGD